jgi:dTDP-4-dehydrorhamnose reductase
MIDVNAIFPIILNRLCRKYNFQLIHISTDCVFSGKKGNYSETDEPDEKGIYGTSKFFGEGHNMMTIRTSIIGEEQRNKLSLLEWLKSNKGKTVNGYTNHFWNGVTCLELARQIKNIILDSIKWEGVRHMFSPIIVSKYTLLCMINKIYDLGITINEMKPNIAIDKTLTTIYSEFDIPALDTQIQQMKEFGKDIFFDSNKPILSL